MPECIHPYSPLLLIRIVTTTTTIIMDASIHMRTSSASNDNNTSNDNDASSMSSMLTASISEWQRFDVTSHRPSLDAHIQSAKINSQKSLQTRKSLAEKTKLFKKALKSVLSDANTATTNSSSDNNDSSNNSKVLEEIGKDTIKAYQLEIDVLTKRCKSAEGANVMFASHLSNVKSDPSDVMASALEYIQSLEHQLSQYHSNHNNEKNSNKKDHEQDQNKLKKELEEYKTKHRHDTQAIHKLNQELSEYEMEFTKLKNQDITIRQLEEQIETLKLQSEQEVSEGVKKLQENLANAEQQRLNEVLEREAALERKISTLLLELEAEKAGRQSSQAHLFQANEGTAELEAAWDAQRKILMDDNEHLRDQLYEASRERDILNLKLSAFGNTTTATSNVSMSTNDVSLVVDKMNESLDDTSFVIERAAYEAELTELTSAASALRDEIKQKEQTIQKINTTFEQKIADLESKCEQLGSTVSSLRAELDVAPSVETVEQMRRELRILKRLEYNAEEEDEEALSLDNRPDPERTSTTASNDVDDVESIMMTRLKKMEASLLRERRAKEESQKTCNQLKQELSIEQEARSKVEKLVHTLEIDLNRAINTQHSPLREAPDVVTTPLQQHMNHEASTLNQILDPEAPPMPESNKISRSLSAEKNTDDNSVATIVMAQRDRLRTRCDALEAERDGFKQELQLQVMTSESLKTDNAQLYEKVKFLQNFRRKDFNDRDLDIEALEQRYEASVDPFKQFSKTERQRKLNEMTPIERIVYMLARQLLATKEARTILFFYILGMHLLVFLTTFHWSHSSACDFSEHHSVMHLHHGPPKIEEAVAE